MLSGLFFSAGIAGAGEVERSSASADLSVVEIDAIDPSAGPILLLDGVSPDDIPSDRLTSLRSDRTYAISTSARRAARAASTRPFTVTVNEDESSAPSTAGVGGSPLLISITIQVTNTGIDPTDYTLLLPRYVTETYEPPAVFRGGLTMLVRDIDGSGGAGILTIDDDSPLYTAFITSIATPEKELFNPPYSLIAVDPWDAETDSATFAGEPIAPITAAMYLYVQAEILPKTSWEFTAELEPFKCPGDCYPLNGDGSIGSGAVNIDDLLELINSFGDVPDDFACDLYPVNDDGSRGNGVVDIDDVIEMLSFFGNCPTS